MIFSTPDLDGTDRDVIAELHGMREELRHELGATRRWQGLLRRNLLARAIQGSNSIEGYVANDDDVVAALEDEPPLTADERTWAEIQGYRQAMSYVIQLAEDEHFRYDASVVRSLHYMLLAHDLEKWPGRYRPGGIYVRDDRTGAVLYEGAPVEEVGGLVDELMADLRQPDGRDAMVRGAMAHLNLVMIHPFRDGNGRMARVLQTLVLAREQIVAPPFASIEEWLGANTQAYYDVLRATGGVAWAPARPAALWIKFNLRAHHMQAQTVRRRAVIAGQLWGRLEELAIEHGLHQRTLDALFDAASGFRVTRGRYINFTGVEARTAARDLRTLVDHGLLVPEGETRGRYYLGSEKLRELHRAVRGEWGMLDDPYPTLLAQVAAAKVPSAGGVTR
jgi:Fic family protein